MLERAASLNASLGLVLGSRATLATQIDMCGEIEKWQPHKSIDDTCGEGDKWQLSVKSIALR